MQSLPTLLIGTAVIEILLCLYLSRGALVLQDDPRISKCILDIADVIQSVNFLSIEQATYANISLIINSCLRIVEMHLLRFWVSYHSAHSSLKIKRRVRFGIHL